MDKGKRPRQVLIEEEIEVTDADGNLVTFEDGKRVVHTEKE